jgi:adenylate cyclase
MRNKMKKRWRHWIICASIAIGSAVGAHLLSKLRFFQLMELKALDAHFLLRGQQPTSGIILVLADQQALDTFTKLPLMFWHPYYAKAIRAASDAGAKVIGLDHAFGIPVDKWERDSDRTMLEAVSSSAIPVVCSWAPFLITKEEQEEQLRIPVNAYTHAMELLGFANLTTDTDDFVRRQELIEAEASGSTSPPNRSFAFRVVEKYLGVDAEFRHGRLTLKGGAIPISPEPSLERSIYINYAGPSGTFPSVSLADVVHAQDAGRKEQLRGWFNGKIVLIGSDTAGDRYATPFFTSFGSRLQPAREGGLRWTTPGVEIHANTVRTLLQRSYLLPAPDWATIGGMVAGASVTAGVVASMAAGTAAIWLLLEGLAILALTHLLFRAGWILPTSDLLVATSICLVASVVYRFSVAEKRGNLFRRAISLFVGKELASSLEDTQTIRLSGERQTATILFTDIRGFTAYTEQVCDEQGPEVVVQQLNEYLATMVSLILKHHGRVNKFIGDGILAVFSDYDEGARPSDHPLRAVSCATEIVTVPGRFQTGAGIHTGLVIVGNVGSAEKMEYTALGDTVNLASRLESLNKEHKTRLLMSETTQVLLRNEVETLHLGTTAVRGKTAPIHLYTVASLMVSTKAVNA